MARISVIYHQFPHYRAPVLRALTQSTSHEYRFFGGLDDIDGIKAFQGDDTVLITPLEVRARRSRVDVRGYLPAVDPHFDATIILGNMRMKAAWDAARRARRNGLKTAYWAHGWRRPEGRVKARLRNHFFSRVDRVFTYGTRAISLAGDSGFDTARIRCIWNSLDWPAQSALFDRYKNSSRPALRSACGMPTDGPVLLCVSRLTPLCQYDLLIDAVAKISASAPKPSIWMIGDGDSKEPLRAQARELGVQVEFVGAVYDEDILARHFMAADLVVSPGKVGLTAMHALAYGTPIVTHGNLDAQMPEVEAITDRKTGYLCTQNDAASLSIVLADALNDCRTRDDIRRECRNAIAGRYTPAAQAQLIDRAMNELLNV